MTDYGETAPPTEEEKQLILRRTPTTVVERWDEDSLARKKQRARLEDELNRKESERYSREYAAATKLQENLEEAKFQRIAQGRNLLIKKQGQVIFRRPEPCPYCEKPVRYVDARTEEETKIHGVLYNPFVNTSGYGADLSQSYEDQQNADSLNYEIKHSCDLNNYEPNAAQILDKKIQALRDELKAFKEHVSYKYLTRPMM